LEKLYPKERPYYSDKYLLKVSKWHKNLSKIDIPCIYIITRNENEVMNNIKKKIKKVSWSKKSIVTIIFIQNHLFHLA
jgi:hypothetical protein